MFYKWNISKSDGELLIKGVVHKDDVGKTKVIRIVFLHDSLVSRGAVIIEEEDSVLITGDTRLI